MADSSAMVTISNYSENPLEMFKNLLERLGTRFVPMNLATVDSEFGVLNRIVVYRGLVDDAVTFVTETYSQKYQNIKANSKVSVTFFFPEIPSTEANAPMELWQVRLLDAEACELSKEQIAKFWSKETVHSKIRSLICECGKPVDHEQLKQQHDQLLEDYKNGRNNLEQPESFTAFKIVPKRWDFYKSEENKIADRIQYRKLESVPKEWEILHIAA